MNPGTRAAADARAGNRQGRVLPRTFGLACIIGGICLSAVAHGQDVAPPGPPLPLQDQAQDGPAATDEVVVKGERARGSAIVDIAPIAVIGPETIKALGVTSLAELLNRLKPLTTSASRGDPVFLLNGRRVSGFGELQGIPPEAIERTEVLSEQDAARFGFAPTVRVVNFITRKRFRAIAVQQLAGTTTEGGGATNYAEATSTRIDGSRRTSLSVSHLRQNRVLQSQRDIVPDPDSLFAVQGNVTAVDGAAAATDPGPYRTLQPHIDTVRVDGTVATPIGRTLNGSLNLTIEAQRTSGLNGLAPALLRVPDDTPALPFADDVLLHRSLPDAVLRQRSTNLNLHAGGTVQGDHRRWNWTLTTTYDRVRSTALADQGVPLDALPAAIDTGGDPMGAIAPDLARQLIRNASRTVTGTLVGKAVANGPMLPLPAGDARMTVSADYARSTSQGSRPGAPDATLDLARTTRGASINVDVPIVSPDRAFAPFLGRVTANGTLGVSGVSDYGRLVNSNYGLTWAPVPPVQLTVSVTETRTPPGIALLTGAVLASPNTPFFDFTTGRSVSVTTLSGGNPALAPERRRVTTLGIAVKPIGNRELRLNLDYLDTRIADQTAYLGGATADFQSAFPSLFLRDALGQLVQADLRPLNIARERERKLRMTINLWTQIRRSPPPPSAPPGAPSSDAPPPASAKPRPSIFAYVTTTWRLDDRLNLVPESPTLDLLDGATLNGTEGRSRLEVEGNLGGSIGPANLGLYARLQGPTRVRSRCRRPTSAFPGGRGSSSMARSTPRNWSPGHGRARPASRSRSRTC